jgi:hypothetical protein
VAGALDEATYVALRARRLPNPGGAAATPGALERSVLIASVVPAAGRHALVEIAFALAGAEGKLVEDDGADLGLSARDRIAPATRVPLRAWFDRLLRVFAVTEVELAQKSDLPSVRVVAATPPWVVVPTALAAQGDPPLTAGLARALARVAVGAFWLDALPPTQSLPLLVAAARQVHGTFGRGSSPGLEGGVVDQERRLGRILGRREKKALAALEPVLRHAPPPQVKELEAAILALRQGAARAAFLVTGDLLATLDELRASDAALGRATQSAGLPALAAVLAHPLAGDVCRYALTREASQLRRRLGSTFSPAAV